MGENYNHRDIEYASRIINNPSLADDYYFKEWVSVKKNRLLLEELRRCREAGIEMYSKYYPDTDEEWRKVRRKLKSSRLKTGYISRVAASLLIMFSLYFILFDNNEVNDSKNKNIIAETIEAGSSKAILYTEDGEKISLGGTQSSNIKEKTDNTIVADSNYVVKYNSALKNKERAEKKYHTIKIPNGGEYRLILADGTMVWLNSASSLRYPTVFDANKRVVELEGEAYFKVAKDKKRPFFVKVNNIETRVLGTQFNVYGYPKENINITLVSGKISLKNNFDKDSKEVVMIPGQNASIAPNDSRINIEEVDVGKYIGWREGYFYFEKERLEDILIKLERWYDFQVFYKNERVKNYLFKMRADRDTPFSRIISRLESTNRIKVSIKGKTVIISDVIR